MYSIYQIMVLLKNKRMVCNYILWGKSPVVIYFRGEPFVDRFAKDLQAFDPVKVGKNLRNKRKKKGLSIAKLSENVPISAGKISYLENGQLTKLHIDDLQSLADSLDTPLTDILNDKTLLTPPKEKFTNDIELIL